MSIGVTPDREREQQQYGVLRGGKDVSVEDTAQGRVNIGHPTLVA